MARSHACDRAAHLRRARASAGNLASIRAEGGFTGQRSACFTISAFSAENGSEGRPCSFHSRSVIASPSIFCSENAGFAGSAAARAACTQLCTSAPRCCASNGPEYRMVAAASSVLPTSSPRSCSSCCDMACQRVCSPCSCVMRRLARAIFTEVVSISTSSVSRRRSDSVYLASSARTSAVTAASLDSASARSRCIASSCSCASFRRSRLGCTVCSTSE